MMTTLETPEIINTHNLSYKYGIGTGLIIALLLILFQISGNDFSPFLKLSKYLVLAVAIVIALNTLKKRTSSGIFKSGISMGTKLSLIAGLTIGVINIILFLLIPEYSFSKYSLEPTKAFHAITISAILFFETLVFGSLMSFMVLQYLKGRPDLEK